MFSLESGSGKVKKFNNRQLDMKIKSKLNNIWTKAKAILFFWTVCTDTDITINVYTGTVITCQIQKHIFRNYIFHWSTVKNKYKSCIHLWKQKQKLYDQDTVGSGMV